VFYFFGGEGKLLVAANVNSFYRRRPMCLPGLSTQTWLSSLDVTQSRRIFSMEQVPSGELRLNAVQSAIVEAPLIFTEEEGV
jgi:hypothetical protein